MGLAVDAENLPILDHGDGVEVDGRDVLEERDGNDRAGAGGHLDHRRDRRVVLRRGGPGEVFLLLVLGEVTALEEFRAEDDVGAVPDRGRDLLDGGFAVRGAIVAEGTLDDGEYELRAHRIRAYP